MLQRLEWQGKGHQGAGEKAGAGYEDTQTHADTYTQIF